MGFLSNFGEKIDSYTYRVINEREARASAGIMFLLGILSLFSVFVLKTLFWAELFSITFIVEFIVRVFINEKFAPYMLLASFIVSNQEPEWVEAKPKQFAWILGVILGFMMAFFIVFDTMTPARLLICVVCLFLLFFESALGICLGCIAYKKFNISLQNCPGGVCTPKEPIKNRPLKLFVLLSFIGLFYATFFILTHYKYNQPKTPAKVQVSSKIILEEKKDDSCTPPQWAVDMGHGEMWKKHNGCE